MAGPRISERLAEYETQLRIATGLVLFTFAATHFLNHSLGLISIEAMDAAQGLRKLVTRSILGTTALTLAAGIHFILGIAKFVTRRTLRIKPLDIVQLAFGLLIPMFLLRHIIGPRGGYELFGIEDNYAYAMWAMWPSEAVNQAILMPLVWVHGCIGIHHWLMLKVWYRNTLWLWYALAILIPATSYMGFVAAGRIAAANTDFVPPITEDQYAVIQRLTSNFDTGYYLVLGAAVALWLSLIVIDRYRHKITISYANGPAVQARRGITVLDASRQNRIPHASVCGGRARCSTCRVRVLEGLEDLPEPLENEVKVLRRVGAPPNVRLACQLRPQADLRIATLLPADADILHGVNPDKYQWGVEQEVTLLFSDLRGFTGISEGRLSFDVVFLLNQFLSRMAEAIEDSGGYVDKFMGDGIMAIFGMDQPPKEGARQALAAARAMSGVLDALNLGMKEDLPQGLQIGIGIHTGPAILGRIGSAKSVEAGRRITALGATVNIASRLETATKSLGAQFAISKEVFDRAGMEPGPKTPVRDIEIRGMTQPITVVTGQHATDIPAP